MTPLWIAIALLLLPALWLLIAPMRGASTLRDQLDHFEANDTSAEQNVAIFQRRLASLEAARERVTLTVRRDGGEGLAERLRSLVATLHVNGLEQPITVSIGVAIWQPGDSCKTLMARADVAMYRAKRSGRNRVELAEERVL